MSVMVQIRDGYFKRGKHVFLKTARQFKRLRPSEIPPDVAALAATIEAPRSHLGPRPGNPARPSATRVIRGVQPKTIGPFDPRPATTVVRPSRAERRYDLPPVGVIVPEPVAMPAPVAASPMANLVRRLVHEILTDSPELLKHHIREALGRREFRTELLAMLADAEAASWDALPTEAPEPPEPDENAPEAEPEAPDDDRAVPVDRESPTQPETETPVLPFSL